MFVPPWTGFSIYEFASWARATIVPCSILMALRPVCRLSEEEGVRELIGTGSAGADPGRRRGLLVGGLVYADRLSRVFEQGPVKPLRAAALREAERWVLDHQEADGTWGGIQPPWVYSLMALRAMGHGLDHPAMVRGLAGFTTFAREDATTWRMDPCISPVWDTALSLLALGEAGIPGDHPAMQRAVRWLVKKQVLDAPGDWRIKAPSLRPGGWPFEFHNTSYPDIDDTALVLLALLKAGVAASEAPVQRGVAWTVGMQSRNGGWGSFDKDNTRRWVTAVPFCDFGEVMDPPTEDVTAHVVETLAKAGLGGSKAARRGVRFVWSTQRSDGSWPGRWGVNSIYGLGAVLPALRAAGQDMASPRVRKAAGWLLRHQQPDGGWGEGCETYVDPSRAGSGPSTASQTAWALIALIAAGEADSGAAGRGVEYLLEHQGASGSWDEPQFTGTGFPGVFMLNYHLYRLYWPVLALGRWMDAVGGRKARV
jgi:squalene-hopene/tetraprenyl-beta-curcumene cyclase